METKKTETLKRELIAIVESGAFASRFSLECQQVLTFMLECASYVENDKKVEVLFYRQDSAHSLAQDCEGIDVAPRLRWLNSLSNDEGFWEFWYQFFIHTRILSESGPHYDCWELNIKRIESISGCSKCPGIGNES
jgi:hypothetical protein